MWPLQNTSNVIEESLTSLAAASAREPKSRLYILSTCLMADEVDFNDAVEGIFLREESAHKASYEEGLRAGSAVGNPEGFHLGYHRGAELGRELGYYLGVVTHYLQTNENSEPKLTEKVITHLTKVKELIHSFPKTNVENEDILGMAETIRSQYKKACALLKIPSNNPYDASVSF